MFMRQDLPGGGFIDVGPLVMEDPIEQLLRQVEAYAEDQLGWDSKPIFLAFYSTPEAFIASDLGPLPEMLYNNPADGLAVFTAVIQECLDRGQDTDSLKIIFQSCLRPDFRGCAVFFESWAVTGRRTSPEQTYGEAMNEYLGNLTPSEHPERQEMRNGIAITTDGQMATIGRIRGEMPLYTLVTGEVEAGGRLPEALALLIKQIQQIATL